MCHSRDFRFFSARNEEKKPEDIAATERRTGVVDAMMSDAKLAAETAERERRPEKEAAPAK